VYSGPAESGGGRTVLNDEFDAVTVVSFDPVPKSGSPAGAGEASGTADPVEASVSCGSSVPSTTSKTYTCAQCGRDFASEKYLNMHASLHFQSAAGALVSPPCPSATAAQTCCPTAGSGSQDVSTTTMMLTSQHHQHQLMLAPPPIRRTKTTSSGAGGTACTSQWTCQICEKTFAQNSNYKNHIRTHSNERPFVCEICAIGYFANR